MKASCEKLHLVGINMVFSPVGILQYTRGLIFIPTKAFARDYGITGVHLSVCLFVITWTDLDKIFWEGSQGKSKPKFVFGYDR